jgi:DNA invertase Pin-like site-specific DNA recombinase
MRASAEGLDLLKLSDLSRRTDVNAPTRPNAGPTQDVEMTCSPRPSIIPRLPEVYRRARPLAKVFREVASGTKTDRPQLRRLLAGINAGDVVMVTRLDRLARSTRDLLNTLAAITGKEAGFRSLADAWADTTTAHGRLMLTVLGGLAEFERELIRARTGEGRARAKARGQSLGRPFKLTPHQRSEAIRRRDRGEPLSDIARSYNVHPSTISRLTA